MAYMSQKKKALLMPGIKKVLDKYGVKATFRVRHHSTLVCTIREGGVDFVNDWLVHEDQWGNKQEFHYQVNTYWLDKSWGGAALAFFKELAAAMNEGNHDNSDPMTDYFDVGFYTDINIGTWEKPYVFNPELVKEVA